MGASFEYKCYYLLAAKGIQDFILRGDKLRLMIGGSELIEGLPNGFLDSLLAQMHLSQGDDYRVLSRAAGGARLLFKNEQQARQLAKLLPLALSFYAPGLDAVQVVVKLDGGLSKTMDVAEKLLQQRRNLIFPVIPVPGPLIERCPRTGLPAVDWFRQGGDREAADAAMLAKDQASKSAKTGLTEKILPDAAKDASGRARFPLATDFEQLTVAENSNVAIVHIDGNGLGSLVMKALDELRGLPDGEAADRYSAFCMAIDEATKTAVRQALVPIVESGVGEALSFYPFRPLVCAGDDVTLVLRAAEAMDFVQRFLESFEQASANEISKVGLDCLENLSLTACAGIAYVKKSFPFAQAYELCESLCKHAKDKTERAYSAVAFWRLTGVVAAEFTDIVRDELTTNDTLLTAMPYAVGKRASPMPLPTIEALQNLKNAVSRMPRGSLRSLLGDLYVGREQAQRSFERICDVAEKRENGGKPLRQLQQSLQAITDREGINSLFTVGAAEGQAATPLHDAIELRAAESN